MRKTPSKYIRVSLIILSILSIIFVFNHEGYAASTKAGSVKLNKKNITLEAGKTYTFMVTLTGGSGSVKWSSSNTKVVGVKDGKITAKKAGTATVTAKYGGRKASCNVKVKLPMSKKKAKKLYKKYIDQHYMDDEYPDTNIYYSYLYLNNDNIPELLLCEFSEPVDGWEVYTIKNNKVVFLFGGTYEEFCCYWEKRGLYKSREYDDGEMSNYRFFNFTGDKKPTLLKSFYSDEIFEIDKKKVSASVFRKNYKNYTARLNKQYGRAQKVKLKKWN